jgi:hypothetical protein
LQIVVFDVEQFPAILNLILQMAHGNSVSSLPKTSERFRLDRDRSRLYPTVRR